MNSKDSKHYGKVAKNDQTSEDSMEKSEYIMIVASDIDICWNALLHDVNDEKPEKYTIHSLKYVILFSCVLANSPNNKINLCV